jgi:formate dehydrogenase subunit gamma
MRSGYVDETWAKEHHEYWYNDIKSGKIKAGTATGQPGAPQAQH